MATKTTFSFNGDTFAATWLNDEHTSLSVTVATDDIDNVRWPSDAFVGEQVGKSVKFSDKGDDLCEAIYHAA